MGGYTILRRAVTGRAKAVLSENYAWCVGVSAIFTGGTYLLTVLLSVFMPGGAWNFSVPIDEVTPLQSGLSTLSSYLLLLLTVPLQLGTTSGYMALVYGEKVSIGSIFGWYRSGRLFLRAVAVYLLYLVFGIAAVLVWFAPPMILAALAGVLAELVLPIFGVLLGISALLSLLLCGILVLAILLSYVPTVYILARTPGMGIRGAFRMRRARMRGRTWEPFRIALRFTGWYLLFTPLVTASMMSLLQFKNLYFSGRSAPWLLVLSLLMMLAGQLLMILYVSPLMMLTFGAYTTHLLSLPEERPRPAGYISNTEPRCPSADEPE